MGSVALLVSLAVGIVGVLGTVVVALLRLTRAAPEQRDADTNQLNLLTTGQQGFIDRLVARVDKLETGDKDKDARITALDAELTAVKTELTGVKALNMRLQRRVTQLIVFIGEHRLIPPPEDNSEL